MDFTTSPMNLAAAQQIHAWKYENAYAIYDTPTYKFEPANADEYLCFWDAGGTLLAYIRLMENDGAIHLGIAAAPFLCGQGHGKLFLAKGIALSQEKFPHRAIRLQVRSWNIRAIKCYESCGFQRTKTEDAPDYRGTLTSFTYMERFG